jgi:hypothetical protein
MEVKHVVMWRVGGTTAVKRELGDIRVSRHQVDYLLIPAQ